MIAAAVVASTGGGSHGFRLRVADLAPCGTDDRRIVVLQALHGDRLRINMEETNIRELSGKLETIFRTRAERVVFVTAEADIPFSRVAGVIDVASTQVDRIALLPSLEVLLQRVPDVCPALVLTQSERRM